MVVGEGLAEQVALHLLASDAAQVVQVLFGLHALGERLDAELLRHVHDRRQDGLRFLAETVQELHVYLELVEVEVLQRVERGIAAAEIVHPHLVARVVEAKHARRHEDGVGSQRGLGYLHVEHAARHAELVSGLLHLGEDVA